MSSVPGDPRLVAQQYLDRMHEISRRVGESHAETIVRDLLDRVESQAVAIARLTEQVEAFRGVIDKLIASGYLPEKCEHDAEPDFCDGCQFAMEKAQQMARIHARAALEAFPAISPAPGAETP